MLHAKFQDHRDSDYDKEVFKAFYYISPVIRKPAFCICENKDADQLRGNREADQPLCFRYTESAISLLPKYEISSLQPSSVAVQPGLCQTWSETPKTGFLRTRLNGFGVHLGHATLDIYTNFRSQFQRRCLKLGFDWQSGFRDDL